MAEITHDEFVELKRDIDNRLSALSDEIRLVQLRMIQ